MIRLKNNTGSQSKPGYIVGVDPKDPKSFVYISSGATKAIGVVMEAVPYRSQCNIATLGERVDVYVSQNVVKGNVLRGVVAGDNRSVGSVVVARSGDAPYLKIGEALGAGRGFIPTIVDFKYLQSDGTTITWDDITGKPTTFTPTPEPTRVVIADTTETTTDGLIIGNSSLDIDVELLPATGSNRIRRIANAGTGLMAVYGYADPLDPSAIDTINGETSQVVYPGDCMDIKDAVLNVWIII